MAKASILIKLASKEVEKEAQLFGAFGVADEAVKTALAELQAEQNTATAKAAAGEIMEVIKGFDTAVTARVTNIRSYRQAIEAEKATLEKLNRAKTYAIETGNYLPLGIMVGAVRSYDVPADLQEVPKDWTPATSSN